MDIPVNLKEIIDPSYWNTWSEEQKIYIVEFADKKVELPVSRNFHANYSGKKWELGLAKPKNQSVCGKCNFAFLFYAKPRNFSLSHTADVWNLLKCANVDCAQFIEICS